MKNKKIIGIVIIVISLILLGTGGFLTYQSMNTSAEENNNQNDEQNNNENTDNNENNNNNQNESNNSNNESQENNISEDEITSLTEKIHTINTYIAPYYTENGIGNVPNKNLMYFVFKQMPNSYNEGHSVHESELNELVKNYFGNLLNLSHESYYCDICEQAIYNYDVNTKMYIYNNEHSGHGADILIAYNVVYIEKIEKENNEYIANAKVAYGYCKDVCGPIAYYATFNDALNGNNKTFDTEPTIDEIKEKANLLPTTTYTFIKENNNFILKNIKIN